VVHLTVCNANQYGQAAWVGKGRWPCKLVAAASASRLGYSAAEAGPFRAEWYVTLEMESAKLHFGSGTQSRRKRLRLVP
jgi:hypothetical protein